MATPDEHLDAQSSGALSRFRRTYVIALSLVGAVGIAGQVVVQRSLAEQLSNAEVINIAGRQRMLSQRMTKSAYLSLALPEEGAQRARADLSEDLQVWEAAHERLARGDLARPDVSVVTPETRAQMARVEPAQRELAAALRGLPDG